VNGIAGLDLATPVAMEFIATDLDQGKFFVRDFDAGYQAMMVSGLATQATSASTLRPTRFPISASVARSGLLNRSFGGSFALKIRSAATAPGSPNPSRTPAI